jgi:hypothetical protein
MSTTTTTKSPDAVMRDVFGIGTRTAVANILGVYARATTSQRADGANWYREVGGQTVALAVRNDVSFETAAVVVAHLSAGTDWSINLTAASDVLAGRTMDSAPYLRWWDSVKRALAAIDASDPWSTFGSPAKTFSFAHNILGHSDYVTIDRWALRIATGDYTLSTLSSRKGAYEAMARCYRLAAKRAGISPSAMQAITWVVARGSAN